MESMKKSVFTALKRREIEMYQAFQKVLDIVLNEAKNKDGKVINKIFVNRINDLIGEDETLKYDTVVSGLNNSVIFELGTNPRGHKYFELFYCNRYVFEAGRDISVSFPMIRGGYIKDGNRLDYEALAASIANEKDFYMKKISNITAAINGADDYIKLVKDVKAYVESALKDLPEDLYTYFTLKPVIY